MSKNNQNNTVEMRLMSKLLLRHNCGDCGTACNSPALDALRDADFAACKPEGTDFPRIAYVPLLTLACRQRGYAAFSQDLPLCVLVFIGGTYVRVQFGNSTRSLINQRTSLACTYTQAWLLFATHLSRCPETHARLDALGSVEWIWKLT